MHAKNRASLTSYCSQFLGLPRWNHLFQSLRNELAKDAKPLVNSKAVFAAVLISITSPSLVFLEKISPDSPVPLSTVAFGICTLLAMVVRSSLKLTQIRVGKWREALSLTHTAFALGCIPAVIVVFAQPTVVTDRKDTFVQAALGPQHPLWWSIFMVVAIAAWAAITEEFIFRGLLVSVLRRWSFLPSQWQRDLLAASASSIIFGVAHYATWGLLGAIALVGLGLGFVLGYIVNGEKLGPLIVYHFFFDALSIAVTVFHFR